ncbi:outer membrane assembly protein BamE, partial [Mesorhizobium sp. M7A.F.Ca.US.002.01.1.1]
MRALNFKSTFSSRPAGAISLLMIVSALSACHTSKMIGDLSPSETLTQGYVID